MTTPILYTFRRCPYAMRARSVLISCGIQCEVREILLKEKPIELLQASPKGTVPVLILPSGEVIEESLDIIQWALKQKPDTPLIPSDLQIKEDIENLIQLNDTDFKKNLDTYKYQKENDSKEIARAKCEDFLKVIEEKLNASNWLFESRLTYGDLAVLPFVRQFSLVEPNWFKDAPYPKLKDWLNQWIQSPLFEQVMQKYKVWPF
jgi:glutathione S-transferase